MGKHRKYTKELLLDLVSRSDSVYDVMRLLNIPLAGGSHSHLSRKIKEFEIDTSHFHSKQIYVSKRVIVENWSSRLVDRTNTDNLRRAGGADLTKGLLELHRLQACELCGVSNNWNNRPIVLEVDHINENWLDDRPENLRFLCPNCHAQETKEQSDKKREATITQRLLEREQYRYREKSGAVRLGRRPKHVNKPKPPKARKTKRPPQSELEPLLWIMSTVAIGKKFGVSDKAVEKWCKFYQLDKPPRGYWAKQKAIASI